MFLEEPGSGAAVEKSVYQGWQPDFVTMYHELVGETLKYRTGYGCLGKDSAG